MRVQPKLVVPGVHLLPFEIGQVYVWDWGEGLTIVDSGITGSEDAILEAVASIGRAPDERGAAGVGRAVGPAKSVILRM